MSMFGPRYQEAYEWFGSLQMNRMLAAGRTMEEIRLQASREKSWIGGHINDRLYDNSAENPQNVPNLALPVFTPDPEPDIIWPEEPGVPVAYEFNTGELRWPQKPR